VLHVRDLRVRFGGPAGGFAAVDGVSFNLGRGGSLALIGESGSGKSTIALSLLRLLPPDALFSGRIELSGEDVLAMRERELVRLRGAKIAMVFHDPLAALDPVMRVGTQISESLRARARMDRRAARASTLELLHNVGLAAAVIDRYPHQLSGGMRQRALIAMAVACGPAVLVCDEPTSALDAVVQGQIIALLGQLRRERGIALLLATHDLWLAAGSCEQIAVLYAGRIVERGAPAELLAAPRHPYTAGLLRSLPPPLGERLAAPLTPVPGAPPPPWARPTGCHFRDRCSRARADCAAQEPKLIESGGREVACFHPLEAP
jgi:oligopeptide/dipeptide ABC transporter ATP-binding protein